MHLINKASIIIIFLAVIVFGYGYFSYERYDWIAVKKPIDISQQNSYEFKFVSQKQGIYELDLETERKFEIREQNCRLGIETYKRDECVTYPEKLVIDWAVYQEKEMIASGKSTEAGGGIWGRRIHKTLARFNTEEGREYRVIAGVTQTDTRLNTASPSLSVSISRVEHKNAFVISGLSYYASYLLAGSGVLLWLLGLIVRRWRLKHNDAFKKRPETRVTL